MADVVERTARRGAHEGVDVGSELDERVGQVRAHEAVGARHEHRAAAEHVAELAPKRVEVIRVQIESLTGRDKGIG